MKILSVAPVFGKRFRLWSMLALVLAIGASAMAGDEKIIDEIIARARAFVGEESALESVQSIRFHGTLKAEGDNAIEAEVTIIVMRPALQKIIMQHDDVKEITGLSLYDGWQKIEEVGNESNQYVMMLNVKQIRRLQANSWEALNFFKGIEEKGGHVEFLGEEDVDGLPCSKLAFVHSPAISFFRFIDVETGRLVMTKTESGGMITEEGSIEVEGIRFPKKIIREMGGTRTTMEFDRITLNEDFEKDFFEVPMF
ncbi:MAG: hypothetical protein JKY51_08580 [Opitutaceae bacterium]|nr:hypothetical protein [Opitutaceae bacterium]